MERQHVGIDLHRRSTTIYRMAEDREVLGTERIVSQPSELAQTMATAGSAESSGEETHTLNLAGSPRAPQWSSCPENVSRVDPATRPSRTVRVNPQTTRWPLGQARLIYLGDERHDYERARRVAR
jgi:hypothetical protein